MIRRQDYENVDYQLSLLRRIVGKGTGSGVSGCNFKAIVEAKIMNSDGVGDAALIEGSRKYAGQIGVFGAALLRQLDGLLEGLRVPVDERGSQFATEFAKQAAKAFGFDSVKSRSGLFRVTDRSRSLPDAILTHL